MQAACAAADPLPCLLPACLHALNTSPLPLSSIAHIGCHPSGEGFVDLKSLSPKLFFQILCWQYLMISSYALSRLEINKRPMKKASISRALPFLNPPVHYDRWRSITCFLEKIVLWIGFFVWNFGFKGSVLKQYAQRLIVSVTRCPYWLLL
jgi:hypothetical protein